MSVRHLAPRPRYSRPAIAVFVASSAALVAWLLTTVAMLSERTTVLTVMVIAFTASWIVTNQPRPSHHRVTLVRARARTH